MSETPDTSKKTELGERVEEFLRKHFEAGDLNYAIWHDGVWGSRRGSRYDSLMHSEDNSAHRMHTPDDDRPS